jgi:hypothetical protein
MFLQNYNPTGIGLLSTLVAAVPILTLLYLIALHPHRDASGRRLPLVPSMIAPKLNAMSRHCRRRSNEMWVIDSLTISNFPLTSVMVYSSIAPTMIHTMPTAPFRAPATKDESAAPGGMRTISSAMTNDATTPR